MKVRLALVALVVAGCRQTENRLHDAEDVATIDVATIDASVAIADAALPPLEDRDAIRAAYIALPPTAAPVGSNRGFFMRCPENYERVDDDAGPYCGKLCSPFLPCASADASTADCCGTHRCNRHPNYAAKLLGRPPDGPLPDACSRD